MWISGAMLAGYPSHNYRGLMAARRERTDVGDCDGPDMGE